MWYDGRPPGQQPPPTTCREAERIASRDRNARVIYGDDRKGRGDDRRDRGRTGDRSRDTVPDSRYPVPDRFPGDRRYGDVAFDRGYADGVALGEEDRRRNRTLDPERHARYRSATRGYEARYGTREAYRDVYREGFRAGYEDGYRGRRGADSR